MDQNTATLAETTKCPKILVKGYAITRGGDIVKYLGRKIGSDGKPSPLGHVETRDGWKYSVFVSGKANGQAHYKFADYLDIVMPLDPEFYSHDLPAPQAFPSRGDVKLALERYVSRHDKKDWKAALEARFAEAALDHLRDTTGGVRAAKKPERIPGQKVKKPGEYKDIGRHTDKMQNVTYGKRKKGEGVVAPVNTGPRNIPAADPKPSAVVIGGDSFVIKRPKIAHVIDGNLDGVPFSMKPTDAGNVKMIIGARVAETVLDDRGHVFSPTQIERLIEALTELKEAF